MLTMLSEDNVTVVLNAGGIASVQRSAARISSIGLTGVAGKSKPSTAAGDLFIDAR